MDYYDIFSDTLFENKIDNLKQIKELNKQIEELIAQNSDDNASIWRMIDKLRVRRDRLLV